MKSLTWSAVELLVTALLHRINDRTFATRYVILSYLQAEFVLRYLVLKVVLVLIWLFQWLLVPLLRSMWTIEVLLLIEDGLRCLFYAWLPGLLFRMYHSTTSAMSRRDELVAWCGHVVVEKLRWVFWSLDVPAFIWYFRALVLFSYIGSIFSACIDRLSASTRGALPPQPNHSWPNCGCTITKTRCIACGLAAVFETPHMCRQCTYSWSSGASRQQQPGIGHWNVPRSYKPAMVLPAGFKRVCSGCNDWRLWALTYPALAEILKMAAFADLAIRMVLYVDFATAVATGTTMAGYPNPLDLTLPLEPELPFLLDLVVG